MPLDDILCSIRPRSGKIKLGWPHYLCGYGIRHASSLFHQTFRKITRLLLFSGIHLNLSKVADIFQKFVQAADVINESVDHLVITKDTSIVEGIKDVIDNFPPN